MHVVEEVGHLNDDVASVVCRGQLLQKSWLEAEYGGDCNSSVYEEERESVQPTGHLYPS